MKLTWCSEPYNSDFQAITTSYHDEEDTDTLADQQWPPKMQLDALVVGI